MGQKEEMGVPAASQPSRARRSGGAAKASPAKPSPANADFSGGYRVVLRDGSVRLIEAKTSSIRDGVLHFFMMCTTEIVEAAVPAKGRWPYRRPARPEHRQIIQSETWVYSIHLGCVAEIEPAPAQNTAGQSK